MTLRSKFVLILTALVLVASLAAKVPRRIKTGANTGFPPYEFVDEKGRLKGLSVDILRELEKQSRLRFSFEKDDCYTIRSKFEAEEVLMLSNMIRTPALEKQFLFSHPYTTVYYSIFTRSNAPQYASWQDLNGKTILLESGSSLADVIRQKTDNVRIFHTAGSAESLERLANGTADAVVLPKVQGFYLISKLNLDNLSESCVLGDPISFCFTLPLGYGELLQMLNRELYKLDQSNKLRSIQNKWFGIYNSDVTSLEAHNRQYRILLFAMLLSLGIIALFLFFSYKRLRQQRRYLELQVAERNNYEREYYQRHQLFISGPIVFLKWNDARRDMFESISDNFSMFGYDPRDLISGRLKFNSVIHPDDLERVLQERQQNLAKSEFSFFQIYRIICPPLPGHDPGFEVVNTWHYRNPVLANNNLAHIRWVFDYTVALPMESSSTYQYYGYILEISAQKHIENELLKQHQAAQVAINTKDIFLTGISIEINSPLNALIGLSRRLSDLNLDEDQKAAMQIISNSAMHLKQILQQIHDFLAILKGSIGSVPQWYVLKRLVEPIIAEFQIKIASKRLAFEHNEFQPAALVFLDADWFQKIIRIILDNAVKFTEEGRILFTVDLSRQRQGKDELVATISDTGVGIPPDKLQLIMEPFTQADETFTRKFGGVGLGLSIARNLVVQMNGFINIESVPGQGTTVVLRFPVRTRS